MFKLQNKVEIIVPKEDNNGVEIDNLAIRESLENITKICGGCTTTDVKGQWWSDNEQRIMQDNNTNFEWYYDKDMEDVNDQQGLLHAISKIARQLIVFYQQEAISIKVNGVLYIVEYEDLSLLSYELHDLMF
ncbi:hypothetical protein [Staphylococcus phage vB_Sau_P68]|nr:hypothetical protein [Staphylococcus phage vB_Sau_P68]